MRRWIPACLALLVSLPLAQAGGPPDRGGRGDRFRTMMDSRLGGMQRDGSDAFDAVRRYFDLTPEQQAAVAKLDEQRQGEQREAMLEINKKLDKKYLPLVTEVLPADQKAKYEQVYAALEARDDATEAARKECREVLAKVRTEQKVQRPMPGSFLPQNKTDLVRQCIELTEPQRAAMDGAQREGWGALRDKMGAIARPQDWRDAEARQKFAESMRKVREEVDAQTAEAMVLLLNDEQKKGYQTAAAALDAYNKKVVEIDSACEKKLTELVGAEKAKAMRAGGFGQQGFGPGQGGPPPGAPQPGEAPKGEVPKKATQF